MEIYSHSKLNLALNFPEPWKVRFWGNMTNKQRLKTEVNYQENEDHLPDEHTKNIYNNAKIYKEY